MRLFINTGGKGERLYPLTKEIPKPMVKIAGKPVLEHLVVWARENAIESIVMMNGYKAKIIESYFGDGKRFGIPIYHSTEKEPMGSGGSIKLAGAYVQGRFAYISGDQVCAVNLTEMQDFHNTKKADLTALVRKTNHPYDSDIIYSDDEGRMVRFISKREVDKGQGSLANAGLCIMEPRVLDLMPTEPFEFEGHMYPLMIQNKSQIFAYQSDEFMEDMGTFERLERCKDYVENR